jgi:hypothetical protein
MWIALCLVGLDGDLVPCMASARPRDQIALCPPSPTLPAAKSLATRGERRVARVDPPLSCTTPKLVHGSAQPFAVAEIDRSPSPTSVSLFGRSATEEDRLTSALLASHFSGCLSLLWDLYPIYASYPFTPEKQFFISGTRQVRLHRSQSRFGQHIKARVLLARKNQQKEVSWT